MQGTQNFFARLQSQHGVERGRVGGAHEQHAHRYGQLRHFQALRGQHGFERGRNAGAAPLAVRQGLGQCRQRRALRRHTVLGQCRGRHLGVAVKKGCPVGQRHGGVAAVFEQRADGGQALVGLQATPPQLLGHQWRQFGLGHGLEVLGVDPAQLGFVELGRAAPEVVEVEPLQKLLAAEDFVVAVAPAQARQVVEQGIGQVAFVAVLRHRLGTVALAHFLALLVEHGGQVRIHRRLVPEGAQDVDLAWGVVDVVVAADDVRDAHVDVIDDDAKVVGRHADAAACRLALLAHLIRRAGRSRAGDHQVVEFGVGDLDPALDPVVPGHHTADRVFEAQHRLHALGNWGQGLAGLGPPGAVVARFFFVGLLALAQRIELGHAHVAGVGQAARQHVGQHRLVARHALHLVVGAFVEVQPEPVHALQDHIDRGLAGALLVGVFDAQDEIATVGARKSPRVDRGADVAQVDEAGGRWSKAGADAGRGAWGGRQELGDGRHGVGTDGGWSGNRWGSKQWSRRRSDFSAAQTKVSRPRNKSVWMSGRCSRPTATRISP